MIGNIEKFVENIKEKGLSKKGSIYAQIIKGERLKKNKTLEEVAEGICSISYLCKMENDVLTPPVRFMKTLFEKMELDYDTISNDDFEESLERALEYFYKDSKELNILYQSLSIYESSPTIKLIKCLYNLKNKNFNDLYEDIEYLNTIKDTLGGLESLVLIYIVLKYYIDIYLFDKALQYLRTLDYFEIETKWLKFLLIEANLVTSFNMNMINRFFNFYNLLDTFSYGGYSFEKRLATKIMYNILKFDKEEQLEDGENKYHLLDKDCLYYSLILRLKKECSFEDNVFDDSLLNEGRFASLYAYNILNDFLKNVSINDERIKKLNSIVLSIENSDDNKIHLMFIKYVLLVVYSNNDLEILNFLRKEYIPMYKKYYHILFDDVLKKSYLYLLGYNSQYKEAYSFLLNTLNLNFKR